MVSHEKLINDDRSSLSQGGERLNFFPGDRWVLGGDPAVRRIALHAERASEVECTVLVTGETGTGKEVWANLIHEFGPRKESPFVPVNCAALTPTLAESQLFGHEKGAFTGATGASLGVFRAAKGGDDATSAATDINRLASAVRILGIGHGVDDLALGEGTGFRLWGSLRRGAESNE